MGERKRTGRPGARHNVTGRTNGRPFCGLLHTNGPPRALRDLMEAKMWNRFISSTYAHLATAIALTLGVAAMLLTAQPQKSGIAGIDAPAQGARLPNAARSSLASQANAPADDHALPTSGAGR